MDLEEIARGVDERQSLADFIRRLELGWYWEDRVAKMLKGEGFSPVVYSDKRQLPTSWAGRLRFVYPPDMEIPCVGGRLIRVEVKSQGIKFTGVHDFDRPDRQTSGYSLVERVGTWSRKRIQGVGDPDVVVSVSRQTARCVVIPIQTRRYWEEMEIWQRHRPPEVYYVVPVKYLRSWEAFLRWLRGFGSMTHSPVHVPRAKSLSGRVFCGVCGNGYLFPGPPGPCPCGSLVYRQYEV